MKKLSALLIVFTMIIGLVPVASAAIPQNNGNGTPLVLTSWTRNSPSSGTYATVTSVDDENFDTVLRFESKGVANDTNYTQYKFYMDYALPDDISSVTADDYVMVSFYYRINTSDTYVAPLTFSGTGTLNRNATTGRNFGDVSKTNEWQYVSYITTVYSSPSWTTPLRQVGRFTTSSNTDKICVDIAEPKAMYMGAVTAEGDVTANAQIETALSSTSVTGVTVGGTPVDLTANPTSYTAAGVVTVDDIAVTTTHGAGDKVVIEESADGKAINIKAYAPYIDWTASDAVPSATYTVNLPEAPYVEITENNGYGTGVVLGTDSPSVVGTAGRDYIRLDTIKGDDAAPFDEYYSWTREAFEVDDTDTNNQSYLAFDGDLPGGASAGDWVYVSFYYRTYNRFTNSAGEVVDNNQMDLYPSIRSNGLENPYYRTSTAKYIRMTPDTTAENDVNEWQKLTYIQKLDNDTNETWTLKLTSNHTRNSTDGTIVGTNRKVDFADVKVVYFGLPEGNTTDEDVIKAAIEEAAGNYGLTNVYLDGEEIDTASNPLSYSVTTPRYSAGADPFTITGNSIHGAGLVNVFEGNNTYVVKSYPLDYDYLSGTDNRVAAYTINVIPEYDFYDFALAGMTLSLKADNGLTASKQGVIIGASYNASGRMLALKAEPFTLTGNSAANALSVTVPDAEGVDSLKFFIWDGIATSIPLVKTIRVDDVTTGVITQ